jgi:hypothetical protein
VLLPARTRCPATHRKRLPFEFQHCGNNRSPSSSLPQRNATSHLAAPRPRSWFVAAPGALARLLLRELVDSERKPPAGPNSPRDGPGFVNGEVLGNEPGSVGDHCSANAIPNRSPQEAKRLREGVANLNEHGRRPRNRLTGRGAAQSAGEYRLSLWGRQRRSIAVSSTRTRIAAPDVEHGCGDSAARRVQLVTRQLSSAITAPDLESRVNGQRTNPVGPGA